MPLLTSLILLRFFNQKTEAVFSRHTASERHFFFTVAGRIAPFTYRTDQAITGFILVRQVFLARLRANIHYQARIDSCLNLCQLLILGTL